jgi:hypothetical protein
LSFDFATKKIAERATKRVNYTFFRTKQDEPKTDRSNENNLNGVNIQFGNIPIYPASENNSSSSESMTACPLKTTPRACPFGGACHTCPTKIQTKLAINQPGDIYEKEADQMAEQVMRTSGVHLQHRVATRWDPKNAPPIVNEVLLSPGQSLDSATRTSMELRFKHCFSQVRVHHDEKAAESAKMINALAYTNGNHIIFNEGQYSPTTEGGKRLLAHELAHTIQQGNNILHRKISFTEPEPILRDPIPIALGPGKNRISGGPLGNTLPGINGRLFPETGIKENLIGDISNVILPQPQDFKITPINLDLGSVINSAGSIHNANLPMQKTSPYQTGKVDANRFNINVFAKLLAITIPQGNKWSGSYPPSVVNNPPPTCAFGNSIQIEMEGTPNSAALYRKILTHEGEHVADLKRLVNEVLKPYHDFLVSLTGIGKTVVECEENIFDQLLGSPFQSILPLTFKGIGAKNTLAAKEFVDKWISSRDFYDGTGGTHHNPANTHFTQNGSVCAKARIIVT